MDVSVSNTSSDGGEWFTASVEGRPQLGAYVSKDPKSEKITIFWQGQLAAPKIKVTIEEVEQLYGGKGQATFVTFVPQPETFGPVSLSKPIDVTSTLGRSQAYRADFSGHLGDVTLWASFMVNSDRGLENGGENIGICLTPNLLLGDDNSTSVNGLARYVIEQAIGRTSSIDQAGVILSELGRAIKSQP
jgi:hypothetical protein